MNQRFLMWGLASIVFVVTLGISSWHEGLWATDEPATAAHQTRPTAVASDDITPIPARPFGPEKPAPTAVPALAAVTPQPPAPPPPPPAETPPPTDTSQPMPVAVADMDEAIFMDHQDRAAQRGSRAR
jgi:type IV secretory pathway VirB10-like protein